MNERTTPAATPATTTTETKWTAPYFGVQHLKPLRRGFQVTVTAYADDFAEAFVFTPGSGFTRTVDERFNGENAAEAARSWGERKAVELAAIGGQS